MHSSPRLPALPLSSSFSASVSSKDSPRFNNRSHSNSPHIGPRAAPDSPLLSPMSHPQPLHPRDSKPISNSSSIARKRKMAPSPSPSFSSPPSVPPLNFNFSPSSHSTESSAYFSASFTPSPQTQTQSQSQSQSQSESQHHTHSHSQAHSFSDSSPFSSLPADQNLSELVAPFLDPTSSSRSHPSHFRVHKFQALIQEKLQFHLPPLASSRTSSNSSGNDNGTGQTGQSPSNESLNGRGKQKERTHSSDADQSVADAQAEPVPLTTARGALIFSSPNRPDSPIHSYSNSISPRLNWNDNLGGDELDSEANSVSPSESASVSVSPRLLTTTAHLSLDLPASLRQPTRTPEFGDEGEDEDDQHSRPDEDQEFETPQSHRSPMIHPPMEPRKSPASIRGLPSGLKSRSMELDSLNLDLGLPSGRGSGRDSSLGLKLPSVHKPSHHHSASTSSPVRLGALDLLRSYDSHAQASGRSKENRNGSGSPGPNGAVDPRVKSLVSSVSYSPTRPARGSSNSGPATSSLRLSFLNSVNRPTKEFE